MEADRAESPGTCRAISAPASSMCLVNTFCLLLRGVAASDEGFDVAVEGLDILVADVEHMAGGISLDKSSVFRKVGMIYQIICHADLRTDIIPSAGKKDSHTRASPHGGRELLTR